MMDTSKGRYWDKPWSLVDGCTPCSPGCEHCWALAMEHRFQKTECVSLSGARKVSTHSERLDIPLRTRKPTVFAVWNDLFHEDVPWTFIKQSLEVMARASRHTFLILTKRPSLVSRFSHTWGAFRNGFEGNPHIWLGCTICNQQEADAKIPELLKVPGKKWLSIEPMLGEIMINKTTKAPDGTYHDWLTTEGIVHPKGIDAVVLGGESGPGARPTHPDWVRSVRDQCAAAGTAFYFKQWGEWAPFENHPDLAGKVLYGDPRTGYWQNNHPGHYSFQHRGVSSHGQHMLRVGTKRAGRLLDGKEHNELPWKK